MRIYFAFEARLALSGNVDVEQIKKAYLNLTAEERREVAHWVLARELSGRAGASLKPQETPPPTTKWVSFQTLKFLLIPVILILIALAVYTGVQWQLKQNSLSSKQRANELAQAEALRPQSPSNLEFLKQNVGKEIIIRGVPQSFDVGFLYFSSDRKKALRLNLLVNGIVLLQSAELEDIVKTKREVEATGIILKNSEGYFEMSILQANRLKLIKK